MTQMYYFQVLFHGQLLLYLHILQIKFGFLIVTAGNLLLSARIFTGIIEVFGTPLLVKLGVTGTIFGIKGMVSKVTISVVVIILNYVLSKLVIFKKEVEN